MRYVAILSDADTDPTDWARAREAEGWDGLAVTDHVYLGDRAVPHVWVTATTLALATEHVTIATAFANNLARSPVEFAQAALSLQRTSRGRAEAGLGAGWDREELRGSGLAFPESPAERAGRYIEAVAVVRELFTTGRCSRHGDWYDIDIPTIGPRVDPPPSLVVSVGGRRTTRALTPLADIVEVKLPGYATTGRGPLHTRTLREVDLPAITARLDDVRRVRADARLSLYVSVGCGADPLVATIHSALKGSFAGRLFGEPSEVAAALHELGTLGVERIQLGAVSAETYELLAKELFAV